MDPQKKFLEGEIERLRVANKDHSKEMAKVLRHQGKLEEDLRMIVKRAQKIKVSARRDRDELVQTFSSELEKYAERADMVLHSEVDVQFQEVQSLQAQRHGNFKIIEHTLTRCTLQCIISSSVMLGLSKKLLKVEA